MLSNYLSVVTVFGRQGLGKWPSSRELIRVELGPQGPKFLRVRQQIPPWRELHCSRESAKCYATLSSTFGIHRRLDLPVVETLI